MEELGVGGVYLLSMLKTTATINEEGKAKRKVKRKEKKKE